MILATLTATIQTAHLRVRTGPALASPQVGTLRRGTRVALDCARLPITDSGGLYEWFSIDHAWAENNPHIRPSVDYWIAIHQIDRRQRLALLDFEVDSGQYVVVPVAEDTTGGPLAGFEQVADYVWKYLGG